LSAAWTNDTTRADALTTQDGIYVKSGATTRRYVGTIRASGANVTEDSAGGATTNVGGKRFVWNLYNQVERHLAVIDTTDSWTYGTATWRQARANAGNQVEFVVGIAGTPLTARALHRAGMDANEAPATAVGYDSTTAPSGHWPSNYTATAVVVLTMRGEYITQPGIGYHYTSWLENAFVGTVTFYGDAAGEGQSGLYATIRG
jgi:hypothetical protein